MKHLFNSLIVVAIALTTGCAAFDDKVISMFESVGITPNFRRGQGHAQVFNAPFKEVWNAVPRAMTSLDFPYVQRYQSYWEPGRGQVRACRPAHDRCGSGDHVFIFVDPEGENRTRVEVISTDPMRPWTRIKGFYHEWGLEAMPKIEQLLLQGKQEKPQ